MGRPTTEKKDYVVKIRVSEEMYEEIRKRGVVSEVVRGFIQDGLDNVPQKPKPEKIPIEDNVPRNKFPISDESYKELESMCTSAGLTVQRFFDRIFEMIHEGYIYIDGIQLKTRGELETQNLEEICHRINASPQEMIDRLTKSLMRG